jgi:hypothetical protein
MTTKRAQTRVPQRPFDSVLERALTKLYARRAELNYLIRCLQVRRDVSRQSAEPRTRSAAVG